MATRTKVIIAVTTAVLMGINSTGANAQLGRLLGGTLGMPPEGEAGGSYQSNNQIRTFITARPYAHIDLYGKVILKAAEMSEAKGFSRFGVTKVNCSTTLMNGSPIVDSCYVIAVMLNGGEVATSRGKRTVRYYEVGDVRAGVIVRPGN